MALRSAREARGEAAGTPLVPAAKGSIACGVITLCPVGLPGQEFTLSPWGEDVGGSGGMWKGVSTRRHILEPSVTPAW